MKFKLGFMESFRFLIQVLSLLPYFVILSAWNNDMRLRMQHPSFVNEAISRKTEFNMQGMTEQEAGVWGIDSILEKLQQFWTAPIQISCYVKKTLWSRLLEIWVFFFFLLLLLLLDECNSS